MGLNSIVALVFLICSIGIGWGCYDYGYDSAKAQQIQRYQEQAALLKAQADAALERERAVNVKMVELEASYLDKQKEIQDNANHTINEYRASNLSLRDSLKPKQCPTVLSAVTSTTSSSDAETTSGLLDTDVEFLVHQAARADEVTKQLEAAQQLLIQDRELCNGQS
ncbi:MAG: hypothetical protein E7D55_02460 [Acinetobacter junii]|nr:hypothetical protein [Acinetobacter junii]